MKENVTSLKEEGPVVVESGKTIVSYSDDVYIKNGFEVKRGAEFFVESYEHPWFTYTNNRFLYTFLWISEIIAIFAAEYV